MNLFLIPSFTFFIDAPDPEQIETDFITCLSLPLQEVAELARKVVLTGFVSVVSPGSMLQIVVASSASLCFLAMHSRCCTSTTHATLLRLV